MGKGVDEAVVIESAKERESKRVNKPQHSPDRAVSKAFQASKPRFWQRWLVAPLSGSLLLVVLDLILLTLLFHVTYSLRLQNVQLYNLEAVLFAAVAVVFATWLIDGYDPMRDKLSLAYASEHILAHAGALVASLSLVYTVAVYGDSNLPSRIVLVVVIGAQAILGLLFRRSLFRGVQGLINSQSLMVIGSAEQIEYFAGHCSRSGFERSLIGLEIAESGRPGTDAEWLLKRIDQAVRSKTAPSHHFEGLVLLSNPNTLGEQIMATLADLHARHIPVFNFQTYSEKKLRRTPLSHFGDDWFLSTSLDLVREGAYANLKRFMDIVMTAMLLVVFSPVIVVVAFLVKLADGGPVFFTQERIGLDQTPFTAYKFRSMTSGSEKGSAYTQQNDTRITWVGKIIRPTRLDEIPQLWNVLRGDMSLIGPRPEWSRVAKEYAEKIPFYEIRHLVRPGLTGWAQVNYPYGSNLHDAKEKLSYDLYYLKRHSFLLDLQIILKTMHLMLTAGGR